MAQNPLDKTKKVPLYIVKNVLKHKYEFAVPTGVLDPEHYWSFPLFSVLWDDFNHPPYPPPRGPGLEQASLEDGHSSWIAHFLDFLVILLSLIHI